jgi:hypothetical protein
MAKALLGMLKVAKDSGELNEKLEGLDEAAKAQATAALIRDRV